jgi:hypothetical protein
VTRSSFVDGIGRDRIVHLGLVLMTALSRIPFHSRILYHWDSVNFANGLRHFDVLAEHPQPPGYIVYVWLGRMMMALVGETNKALVWISIIASALAVVMLYRLGRTMWSPRVGLMAALFLAASPLFWFYGQIALPHTLDTLLTLTSLWMLYHVRQGREKMLWPAVLTLAFAGGVRQQTLVFLLPVALYATWRVNRRHLAVAGAMGLVACLFWLIPLLAGAGGLGAYLTKMDEYGARFNSATSVLMGAGWAGITYNVRRLLPYTLYGLGLELIPLLIRGVRGSMRLRRISHIDRPVFLILWITPSILFYAFIHMGQQGLVLIYLPALLLMAAAEVDRLLTTRAVAPVVIAIVLVQALFYNLAPEYPFGIGGQRLLTRETLARSDAYYIERFEHIRAEFDPKRTLILAANWEHVRYYLPEYRVAAFEPAHGWGLAQRVIAGDEARTSEQGVYLVLFDPLLAYYNTSPSAVQRATLPGGDVLEYLAAGPRQVAYVDGMSFGITEQ